MKLPKWILKLIKRKMEKADEKALKTLPPYEGKTVFDLPYLDDGDFAHAIDIYYASAEKRKDIVVLDIHGGAYIKGTRKAQASFARVFLDKGYDFISADYRLCDGEIDVHDQIYDLSACLKFIYDKAPELGLNRDRIFLVGDSCGGHYALLLAEFASNPKMGKDLGFDIGSFAAKGVLLNCPVFDYTYVSGRQVLSNGANEYMYGPKWYDESYTDEVSPKTYFNQLKMPIFYSTCSKDFIRPECLKLHEAVLASGLKEYRFLDISSDDKEVVHIHNVSFPDNPKSKEINDAMDEFMKKYAAL